MGGKTTTQTTERTLPGRTGAESSTLDAYRRQLAAAEGQLGDVGGLARGDIGGPTGADQALIQQSIGATGDMVRSEFEQQLNAFMAQMDEEMARRGVQGSSIELARQGTIGENFMKYLERSLGQEQLQGSQALMNLPFQRAGVQLGANQQLVNQLIGMGNPTLQHGLNERINQGTTTQTQESKGFTPTELMQLGVTLANPAAGLGSAALSFLKPNGPAPIAAPPPMKMGSPFQIGGY